MYSRNMPGGDRAELIDPFTLSAADGYAWLKGNLHSHTTCSDGRLSPQQRADAYAANGYDFLAITDHYRITSLSSITPAHGLVLIQGVELHPDNPFGGQVHHFVGLHVSDDIDAAKLAPQHVIDAVREQGGSVWLAHPYWSSVCIPRDTLPLRGLAGIEVFNAACGLQGKAESAVHWDEWMLHADRLFPALANDDSHFRDEDRRDTYEAWTMVRTRERSATAIVDALVSGASYGTTGPVIHDIQLRRERSTNERRIAATVVCSEAKRIDAISDLGGASYREQDATFEQATFSLKVDARWVRFEVIAPDGNKAWSNPFDLSAR